VTSAAAALRGDTFCNTRRGKNGNEKAAEMAEISSRASSTVDARTKRDPERILKTGCKLLSLSPHSRSRGRAFVNARLLPHVEFDEVWPLEPTRLTHVSSVGRALRYAPARRISEHKSTSVCRRTVLLLQNSRGVVKDERARVRRSRR